MLLWLLTWHMPLDSWWSTGPQQQFSNALESVTPFWLHPMHTLLSSSFPRLSVSIFRRPTKFLCLYGFQSAPNKVSLSIWVPISSPTHWSRCRLFDCIPCRPCCLRLFLDWASPSSVARLIFSVHMGSNPRSGGWRSRTAFLGWHVIFQYLSLSARNILWVAQRSVRLLASRPTDTRHLFHSIDRRPLLLAPKLPSKHSTILAVFYD